MQHNPKHKKPESHYISRIGWVRAAVLGANDGIISISSLMIGIASASGDQGDILLTGIAGLVAGAMSMAAGEYVSVCSQSDLEEADLKREAWELEEMPEAEIQELTNIYIERGVEPKLAREVSIQMMEKDALGTHAREELGISEITKARPIQAALASAASFSFGGIIPVLTVFVLKPNTFVVGTSILSLILLGLLGAVGARIGKAHPFKPSLRIMFWGAMAMGFTALIGKLLGTQLI